MFHLAGDNPDEKGYTKTYQLNAATFQSEVDGLLTNWQGTLNEAKAAGLKSNLKF